MVVYITGTGKGIGKSLAEKFLENNYKVFGLSRNNTIKHPNFEFIKIDLSKLDEVKKVTFQLFNDEVLLINNAGIIGALKPIGNQTSEEIEETNFINLLSPQILINKFISQYKNSLHQHKIINISSGAAKYPIDAWATYCSSKSAIDLFSETVNVEFLNRKMNNWKIYSIAPGVVNTEMQKTIRSADINQFKEKERFIQLHENGDLVTSKSVADNIYHFINQKHNKEEVLVSLKNYTINE